MRLNIILILTSFNLGLLVMTMGLMHNFEYPESSFVRAEEYNSTNSLEVQLSETQMSENTVGYICIPVSNTNISENGYRCEPCELFPGLCNDILSRFNTT